MKSDRSEIYEQLRKKYPIFVYENFSYTLDNNKIRVVFEFWINDEYVFHPEIKLPVPTNFDHNILADSLIRNIIFNMGMIELISYWKAACPPMVIIKPMALTSEQIKFWKKLYLNGLGEFFYENGITPADDFLEIEAAGNESLQKLAFEGKREVLVPIGGGKDSVVTIELLSKIRNCRPFIINPREASIQSSIKSGYSEDQIIKISRSIDPLLLDLNEKGFLNGHTPFSAMLAFTATLTAAIHGIAEIALSNESSANEPTIPGTNINHQYSKTYEFENDFRKYISDHVTDGIEYFSFLRPLNELQIAGVFSQFPEHFPSFKSCNVGSKTDSWCGKCPKCLFTYIILGPFVKPDKLIRIFGGDLFEDDSLIPVLDQLCGIADEKPFECIGTIDEVNVAIREVITQYGNEELPKLLSHYSQHMSLDDSASPELASLLKKFDRHNIPGEDEVQLLKEMIHAL